MPSKATARRHRFKRRAARQLRRVSASRRLGVWVTACLMGGLAASCAFELGELVTPGTGGGGGVGGDATGGGGSGGSGAQGGGSAGATRTRIDADTAAVGAPLVDFPLLVTLNPSRVDYAAAGIDGASLRFYAADGATLLSHEIERWVDGGESHVWVKIPAVDSSNDVVVWMRVGEPSPATARDPATVWSAYQAVFHFADALPGAVIDASQGLQGTAVGMDASNSVDARFGAGFALAAGTYVDLGSDATYQVAPNAALTADVWFQRASTAATGFLISGEGCCLGWGMALIPTPLQFRGQIGVGDCCNVSDDYRYAQFNMPGADANTDWHHSAVVMDRAGGVITAYLDGVEQATNTITATSSNNQGSLIIGAAFDGTSGVEGTYDELRFRARATSPDWIKFQYDTMTEANVSFGQPEPLP